MIFKPQRRFLVVALSVAVVSLVGLATPAAAGRDEDSAPRTKTVDIVGGNFLKINESISTTYRFKPGKIHIQHGAKLVLSNHTDDVHTLTLVDKSLLPKTINDVFNCGGPGTICAEIFHAHIPQGPPPPGAPCSSTGNPPCNQYIDNGQPVGNPPNLDTVNTLTLTGAADGDSVIIAPGGAPIAMTVTAPPGSHLPFMCVIHAWMQGEIVVGADN